MGLRNAAVGGAVAGTGLLALLLILAIVLLKVLFVAALAIVVFGGAYLVLEHFGVLAVGLGVLLG